MPAHTITLYSYAFPMPSVLALLQSFCMRMCNDSPAESLIHLSKQHFWACCACTTCPLHSILFVLWPDHLAVSTSVESPPKNPLCPNSCSLGDIVPSKNHDLNKLRGSSLIICCHFIVPPWWPTLQVSTISSKTRKGSMHLVFLDRSPCC